MDPLAADPDATWLMLAYGTLKEGEPTHGGAAVPRVVTLRRGLRIPGRLYDVGDYPAATIDHEALAVGCPATSTFTCDLVRVGTSDSTAEQLAAALAAYDAYEADDYRRVRIPLDDPQHPSAWIYEWVGPLAGLTPIPSGIWTSAPPL